MDSWVASSMGVAGALEWLRLIPAQYVYVKTSNSDYIDAEAIAEAVGRPRMRFVPIKTDD
jgi:transposase